MNIQVPGGGEFGRSAKREVRNPVLRLPAARALLAHDPDAPFTRRDFGLLLRELAKQAMGEAERSLRANKWIMATYWKVVSVYTKHLAHVIDPPAPRKPKPE